MKALSITQPWASLIARGGKMYETRSWGTGYRGPLAIHAAVRMPGEAQQISLRTNVSAITKGWLPRGAIVAIARLTQVFTIVDADLWVGERERSLGDWRTGRFAWKLEIPRPLYVAPAAKGKLGLWDWDERQDPVADRASAEDTRELLESTVDEVCSLDTVLQWTPEQRAQAIEWASNRAARGAIRWPRPEFLPARGASHV